MLESAREASRARGLSNFQRPLARETCRMSKKRDFYHIPYNLVLTSPQSPCSDYRVLHSLIVQNSLPMIGPPSLWYSRRSSLPLLRKVLESPSRSQGSLYGIKSGKQHPSCTRVSSPSARLRSRAAHAQRDVTQPQHPCMSRAEILGARPLRCGTQQSAPQSRHVSANPTHRGPPAEV